MFELLEKIRQKPEKTRKRIAFLVSLGVVLIILVIWVSVVMPDFTQDQAQQAKAIAAEPSPLSTFSSTLSSGFSAIGAQLNSIKSTFSSFSTDPAHFTSTSSESFAEPLSTTTGY